MNYDALNDRYLKKLNEATALDDAASMAMERKETEEAANGYEKAAVLYAEAAKVLMEVSECCPASEQSDFEKSVDRLISASKELKALAAKIRQESTVTSKNPTFKNSTVPAGNDDETIFIPTEAPETSFQDIAGLEDAKQLIMEEIINPTKYPSVYKAFGISNNGGLMLFGPPGSGKTMMARAVAAQANMPFFSIRCSDIVGKYFGEAEKHVQALFNAARQQKKAVIFFDEAEALACRRGGNSTVMNRLVPELLTQMDGFDKDEDIHIIVIFATNRPYDIDPGFLRPGRLPNQCYIPLPDLEVRRSFLKNQLANRPCEPNIDVDKLAAKTDRFSCADLLNLVKRGCMQPTNRCIAKLNAGEPYDHEMLTQADLEHALSKLHPSVEAEEVARLEKWIHKVGIQIPAAL